MNADNISFVPGIPNKPEKTIINFDMERTTEAMVTDMYDRNLFYPVRAKINSPKKKKDENNCFLKFSLINTQNLQKTLYTDKNKKKLRVGRHKEGDIVIEDIRIRD